MAAEQEARRRTEHVPEWKREEVDELVELIESYDSVGVVDIAGIPSRQLQEMRRSLHGTTELRISRNTLLVRALEEVDEGVETLVDHVSGQVGLVGTDENPFSMYRELEASKTPAPINAGEVTPDDIVIPEGDTGIDPGPFVGELQQVGANARIQEGSIHVLEDSTVLEAGEEVDDQLANVLSEMGIEPKEVGLDLRAVYADGVYFEPDELALDYEAYQRDVEAATNRAFNLSVNANYPTTRTAGRLLSKAAGRARSLGLAAAVEDPELLPDLLGMADGNLRALAARIDDEEALPEELRGQEIDVEDETETGAVAATGAAEEDEDEDEAQADEPDESAAEDDDGDDDDDAGGEGLGAMFG
jgi:large subunit ribosomal protein L10